jgi:small conductance mechanosensitive channel
VSDWLSQLQQSIYDHPLDFGLRAGAIFLVVVGALVLGRWLQTVVRSFPTRHAALRDGAATPRRSALGRWLGRVTFASVLLAAAFMVVTIVEYDNRSLAALNPQDWLSTLAHSGQRALAILLLIPLTLGAASLLQRGTLATLDRTRADPNLRLLAGRAVYATTLIVGGLAILAISGVSLVLTATLLGALTLALSLALQDVLRNVFAGVYLLVERPFIIGDEIAVASFAGHVEDIQLRVTSLRTAGGERVLVPNALLFTSAVVNASAYQRRRIVLSVALPADAPDALDALEQIMERIRGVLAGVPGVLLDPPPQVTLDRASQGKVYLRAIFWVPARDPNAAQIAVSRAVDQLRRAFADAEVGVADLAPAPAS